MNASSPFLTNNMYRAIADQTQGQDSSVSTTDPNPSGSAQQQKEEFSDADLGSELAALTLTANRANTTIYTIDPRGLVGMPDLDGYEAATRIRRDHGNTNVLLVAVTCFDQAQDRHGRPRFSCDLNMHGL